MHYVLTEEIILLSINTLKRKRKAQAGAWLILVMWDSIIAVYSCIGTWIRYAITILEIIYES